MIFMDRHNLAIFGKKVGIIIDSDSMKNPHIFIRALKCKDSGVWEKSSLREGISVNLKLSEIIAFSEVLNGTIKEFKTMHKYKESTTAISIVRDSVDSNLIKIRIGAYDKPIVFPDTILLSKFISHLIDEKIANATVSTEKEKIENESVEDFEDIAAESKKSIDIIKEKTTEPVKDLVKKQTSEKEETMNIKMAIKNVRPKAILIVKEDKTEKWIPRSAIISNFDEKLTTPQDFTVKVWAFNDKPITAEKT